MLNFCRSANYIPTLKWRWGERHALSTISTAAKNSLLPLFLMPPSGDYDHEKDRVIEPLEHVKLFGGRLNKDWGRRPAFVDAGLINGGERWNHLDEHPLTELLGRAHAAGAQACPATAIGRSADYQLAVQRFAAREPNLPVCVRATSLHIIGSDSFGSDLLRTLAEIGCAPKQVVLNLDFSESGALKVHEVDSFAELLVRKLNDLPALYDWLSVAVTLSAFPTSLKTMKPGEVKPFPRTDWLVYERLAARRSDLGRLPICGDYAIDSSCYSKPIRASPSATFRYTVGGAYIVAKGAQAKKPVGYAAIYPVANTLAHRDEFMGARFSDGDAFIDRLSTRQHGVSTGHAGTWRWAGTDHHFTMVTRDLANLNVQRALSEQKVDEPAEQGILI